MAHKILVVDDEPRIVQIVQTMLTTNGYNVVTAHDGHEALQRLREERPDLVLLDIIMPHMDGTTVAEQLRQHPDTAHLPVIFLTSLVAADEIQAEGHEIGGHLFLAKPFSLQDLLAVVRSALGPTEPGRSP